MALPDYSYEPYINRPEPPAEVSPDRDQPAVVPTDRTPPAEVPAETPAEVPAEKAADLDTLVQDFPDPGVIDAPGSIGAMTDPRTAQASEPGFWPTVDLPEEFTKGRAAIQAGRVRSMDELTRRTDERMEEDRARIKRAYDATAIGPDDLPKWDYEKQRAKTRTDPLESFGSAASIFAMLAAAFTKAPMENAMLGAAGAMNAIRANNDEEYNKAFEAWKANSDLALKRHGIMQQNYQNALSLMNSDMGASRQQMQMLAAKYDDQQVLFMLQHGFDKEALEIIDKRNTAMVNLARALPELTKARIQQNMLEKDPEFNNEDGDPQKRAARKLNAFNRIYHGNQTTEAALLAQFMYENPNATAEEIAEFRYKYFGYGGRPVSAEQAFVQKLTEALNNGEITEPQFTEQLLKFYQSRKGGAGMAPARPGSEAEQINTIADDLVAKGLAQNRAEAIPMARQILAKSSRKEPLKSEMIRNEAVALMKPKEEGGQGLDEREAYKRAAQNITRSMTAPSGNRIQDMENQREFIKESRQVADNVIQMINKNFGIAGVGGMITRPMEAVGNMLSITDETDRAQFRANINLLRELGPRILTLSGARPLAIDAKRIDSIIPGLEIGATVANTKRAINELRKIWEEVDQHLATSISGYPSVTGARERPKEQPAGGWWKGLKDRPVSPAPVPE